MQMLKRSRSLEYAVKPAEGGKQSCFIVKFDMGRRLFVFPDYWFINLNYIKHL